jgi:hypothetical protein
LATKQIQTGTASGEPPGRREVLGVAADGVALRAGVPGLDADRRQHLDIEQVLALQRAGRVPGPSPGDVGPRAG